MLRRRPESFFESDLFYAALLAVVAVGLLRELVLDVAWPLFQHPTVDGMLRQVVLIASG